MTRVWIERLRASVLSALLLGTVLTVVVSAPTSASAQTTDPTTDPTTTDTDTPAPDREFAGADRYETSANLAYSYAAKSSSSNSVILAGGGLIDAAAAAGLARAFNAPVLLTPTGTLSPQARQFIIDQRIRTVYVVGGEAAVSAAVAAELAAIPNPPAVERLAGPDRYATSAALSRAIAQPAGAQPANAQPADYCGTGMPTAVLANVDKTFADVIALGPLAYSQRVPVLLTSVGSLSQAVSEYLTEANIEQVVVVGGEAAVSPAVVAQLQAAGVQVQRVSGPNRYATALSIREAMGACEGLTLSPSTYALINGEASADGIAAGPLLGLGLGRDGVTPVLLVEKDQLPPESRQHLDAVNAAQQSNPSHPPVVLTVIGGVAVVSPAVAQAAAETANATQAVATTSTTIPPDDDDDDDDDDRGGGGGGGGRPNLTTNDLLPAAVITLTGLPTEAVTYFVGGSPVVYTVASSSSTAQLTASSTDSRLVVSIAEAASGTAGEWTLTVTLPTFSDTFTGTVTITATDPAGVLTAGSAFIDFTVTPTPAIVFNDLDTADTSPFEFGDSTRDIDFTVSPPGAAGLLVSFEVTTLFTTTLTPTNAATGAYRLSLTPPATDGDVYAETITLRGFRDFATVSEHELDFTINPATVGLTGVPSGTDLALSQGSDASEFTLTADPIDATVDAASVNDVVTVSVVVLDAAAGTHTLTITPPTSGTTYTDMVTITATDPDGTRPEFTETITLSVLGAAPTFSGLGSVNTEFRSFGLVARTTNFTVSPATAAVTISDSRLFNASVTDNGSGSWTLSLQPLGLDPNIGSYTETLTITATDTNRTPGTHELVLTITQPVGGIAISNVVADTDTALDFGGAAATVTFDVDAATVTFTAVSDNGVFTVTETDDEGVNKAFTVAAPATDDGNDGPYTDTITLTVDETGRAPATQQFTFTIRVPIALSNLPAATQTAFNFGDTSRTVGFTVDVTSATIAAASTNGVFTVTPVTTTGANRTFIVAPPATDVGNDGPYTDTVTFTVSDPAGTRGPTTHTVTFTVRKPIRFISLPTGTDLTLDYAAAATDFVFTVDPVDATVTAASTNGVVTVAIAPVTGSTTGEHTLTITPPNSGSTYTDTVTITGNSTGLVEATETLTFTINPPTSTAAITNVVADTTVFDFGDPARTVTFTVAPDTATFTAVSTNGVFTVTETDDDGASKAFTVAPPATDDGDDGPYTDRVTITASAPGRVNTTQHLTFNIREAIRLTGLPADTETTLAYGAAATEFTIVSDLTTATVEATSANSAFGVAIAPVTGTAGSHTLTITPPSTGTTYTDTITITATDPTSARAPITQAITFTASVLAAPVFSSSLAGANTAAFSSFGRAARTTDFTVTPATATVTVSDTDLFTVSVTETTVGSGNWRLSVRPPAGDPATGQYSETITVTAVEDGRAAATQDLTFTVTNNQFTIAITNLVADTSIFDFGDDARTVTFNVNPTSSTFTVASQNSVFTVTETDDADASKSFTIAPPATDDGDDGPYTDTVIITVTDPADSARRDATRRLTYTLVSPSPVELTGVPTGAQLTLDYGAAASTFTLTADPIGANVTATSASANSVVTAAIAPVVGTPGQHTLTITPPSTGTTYTDTVTITATDPDGGRTAFSQILTFTVTPRAAATFTDQASASNTLATAANTAAFNFGDGVRTINFTVNPATVPVTIAPASSTLFSTWSITSGATAGSYTLTIQPLGTDPGTGSPYSETLTITASEDGRTPATQELAFTITSSVVNPGSVTVTGLPADADLTFEYASAAVDYELTVDPPNVNIATNSSFGGGTVRVTSTGATRTLTFTPPDTDTVLTKTTTFVATDPDGARDEFSHVLTFTTTLRPQARFVGLPNSESGFNFGEGAREIDFTVSPTDVPVTVPASSNDNQFTASVTDNGGGSWTLSVTPAATDSAAGGPYFSSIRVTAAEDGRVDAIHDITLALNPPPIVLTGLPTAADLTLDYGAEASTFTITADPTDAVVTATSASTTVADASIVVANAAAGTHTLTITPAATGTSTATATVTIGATDPNPDSGSRRTAFSEDFTFTVNPVPTVPVTITGLPTAAPRPFTFSGTDRVQLFPFTFTPANATFTATATGLITPIITGAGANRTLQLLAPTEDVGTGPYTDTITFTASAPGFINATHVITATITPAPVTITLTSPDTSAFNHADSARSFSFTVTPENATVVVSQTNDSFTFTVTDSGGSRGLSVTPPTSDDGTGPYSNTITLTASTTDGATVPRSPATATQTLDVTVTPSPATVTGLPSGADLTLEYGAAASVFTLTAFPTDATVTATATGSTVTATVDAVVGTPGSHTLTVTPAASGATATATVTIDATDTDNGRTAFSQPVTFTVNPPPLAAPTFDDVTGDNVINIADQTTGVTLTGGVGTGTTVVTVCFGGSDDACTGGTSATATVSGTTWTYTLVAADFTAMGQGSETLRATATGTGGSTSTVATRDITVDTVAPGTPDIGAVGVSDVINAAERSFGVLFLGNTGVIGNDATDVTVCIGGSDDACTGGEERDAGLSGSVWSYQLTDADYTLMGEGPQTLRVTAFDAADNPSPVGTRPFTIDTLVPVFTSGATGAVAVNAAITVTAYDAEATDNGGASETPDAGITYSLSGTDAALFDIDSDNGEITYLAVQSAAATHAIIVTATDAAGNATTLDVTISVVAAPTVTISDSVDDDYANGAVTFTFAWSEDVTGFEAADLTYVLGHARVSSETTTLTTVDDSTYTTVFTPDTSGSNANNDATVDITVAANAVTGATSGGTNIETTASQKFDTIVPVFAAGATATATFTTNAAITTEVYDAEATDHTGAADAGITYSLSGTDAALFAIDSANGVVTYLSSPTTAATHTFIVTATDKGVNTATITVTVTVSPPPPVTISGLPDPNTSPFAFSGPFRVQLLTFTVSPASATFTATAAGAATNGITATVTGAGTSRTLTTTAPTTDNGLGPYTDTVTVTGSAPGFADAAHNMAITLVPAPVTITLTSPDTSAFNHADGSRDIGFTVAPANATVEVSQTNDSFTATIVGSGGSRTLSVTPPASDDGTGADAAAYSNTITLTATTTDAGTVTRTPATATDSVTVTVNPAPIALTGLPTGTALTLSYGNAASTFTLTAFPTDATVTAGSTSSAITTGIAVLNADAGTHTLTITPATSGTTTTATVTIGATDANSLRTAFSQTVDFTVSTAPPVVLTGTVITDATATVRYAGTAEYTITADPATATLDVASSDSVVGPSIARGTGAGVWTLTLTAPTSGTTLTDMVTITATDSTRSTTTSDIAVTVSLRPEAAISADLSSTDVSPFEFGDAARFTVFSVNPGTVPLTYSPTTSAFFRTWEINPIGSSGDYGLNIYPLATDPDTATSYSETLTVTATEDGREPVTVELTFTINPSPVSVTGLPTGTELALTHGAAASTFTLTAFPTDATVTATATPGSAVTASVDPVVGTPGNHTLTITPAATGSNTVTATVTIGATDPDGVRTMFSQPVDFLVSPAATEVVLSDVPSTDTTPFTFDGEDRVQTFGFTVTPGTATVTATAGGAATNGVTATVTGTGTSRTLTVTAPTADTGTGPYSDTITLTASATGLTNATLNLPITLTPAPVSITFVGSPQTAVFDHGDGSRMIRFTATPDNAVLTVDQTNDSFTSSIFPGVVNLHVLRVAPPSSDDATDSSAYTNTITLTATTTDATTGRTPLTASQTLTFTVNPGPVAVDGLPSGAELTLDYAASASTFTLVANPTDATVTATSASANGIVAANVVPVSGTPGSHTLTITPPSTGSTYTDMVTITATDPDAGRPQFSQILTFTVTPPPAITFPQALPTAIGPLAFGGSTQQAIFSVDPATATVNAESVDGILDIASVIVNSGAIRTLRYRPPATDGLTYSDTIRVTATAPGYAETVVDIPVTFVEPVVSFTGLDTADTNFGYGTAARDIVFTVTPADATVMISATTIFTTSITAGTGGSRTLTVTPPADNTGGTEETVTITGTSTGLTNGTYDLTLNGVDPAVITLDATHESTSATNWDAVTATLIELEFGGSPRYQAFKVTPTDATVTAASANSLFTVAIQDTHVGKLLVVTPPATDGGTYSDTVTITASHADYGTTTLEQTFSINPAADTDTAVTITPGSAYGAVAPGGQIRIFYSVNSEAGATYAHAVSLTGLFPTVQGTRGHGPTNTSTARRTRVTAAATNDVLGGALTRDDRILVTVGAPGFRTVTRTFIVTFAFR